jgi:selenocysteine lyase/cysteine desulfurase
MDDHRSAPTSLDRRSFLARTALVVSAAAGAPVAVAAERARRGAPKGLPPEPSWPAVRAQFELDRRYAHLAGLLLASHPRPVRDAIERHRRGLDRHPVHYLYENRWDFEARVLDAAASYLGADPADVALTDSTTMGLGTLYTGLRLREGQEAVATTHCHYSTRESLRLRASRTGASVREVSLYRDLAAVSADEVVDAARAAVTPATRVLAVTWVHSSTGLKIPIRPIADALAELNRDRDEADRVLLCVDGVHAFGIEDVEMADLGCDFFVAGCHKWLLGPRGTGLVWGRPEAWAAATPTIPSFSSHGGPGGRMTPGGFHSFEHRWALAEAFEFQLRVGKARVAARVRDFARHLKEGLAAIPGVKVHTPASDELSAGLVCFDLDAMSSDEACEALWERRVVASVAPYASRHLRFAPGIANTHADVERALREVRALAKA